MILDFGLRVLDSLKSKGSNLFLGTKDRIPKIKILVISAFLIFGVNACTKQEASRQGIVIADSRSYAASIFRQNCAVCHGAEAYGKTVDGKPVPSLRFGKAAKKSREEIYEQIKYGKLPMPGFENQLTESEINQMVDFIMRDLQDRDIRTGKQRTPK